MLMRVIPLLPAVTIAPIVVGVTVSYANRRDGWYVYAHDADGNQIGEADYRFHREDAVGAAKQMAREHGGVPVTRDFVAGAHPLTIR